jgi:hypothetical protein
MALTRKVGEKNTPEAAKKIPSAFGFKVVTSSCERGNCGIWFCDVCSSLEIIAHTFSYSNSVGPERREVVVVMTDIYPTVEQCAIVATALKLLLFPA